MSDLFVESWGAGAPVVLVHGSLATGSDEWQAQRPLADAGYCLFVPDRRGYGRSPAAQGEDFLIGMLDMDAGVSAVGRLRTPRAAVNGWKFIISTTPSWRSISAEQLSTQSPQL